MKKPIIIFRSQKSVLALLLSFVIFISGLIIILEYKQGVQSTSTGKKSSSNYSITGLLNEIAEG